MKKLILLLLVPTLSFSSINYKEKLNEEIQRTKYLQKELSIYNNKNNQLNNIKRSYKSAVNEYDKAIVESRNYIKYISFTDRKNGLKEYYDIRIDNYLKSIDAGRIKFKNNQLKQNIRDIVDLLLIQKPNLIIGIDEEYNVLIDEKKL